MGSIFLRVLHCLLFATINLIADGAACQCMQCHSFFTKKGEKKSKLKPCCSRRPQCILRRLQSAIHCTLQPFVTHFYLSVKKRPRASCHSCICQATYVPVDRLLSSTEASYPTHKRSVVLYTWFSHHPPLIDWKVVDKFRGNLLEVTKVITLSCTCQ